jgi:hypothetical protein
MKNLWLQLKTEHKQAIKEHQKNYKTAPKSLEDSLSKKYVFSQLTVEELRNLFTWTNTHISEMDWQDVFGDRFLIKN